MRVNFCEKKITIHENRGRFKRSSAHLLEQTLIECVLTFLLVCLIDLVSANIVQRQLKKKNQKIKIPTVLTPGKYFGVQHVV